MRERHFNILEEKWYTIRRLTCKDGGTLDICTVKRSDDPNSESRNRMGVAALSTWYRLNDGKWERSTEFERNSFVQWYQLYSEFNAEELYNEYKTNSN